MDGILSDNLAWIVMIGDTLPFPSAGLGVVACVAWVHCMQCSSSEVGVSKQKLSIHTCNLYFKMEVGGLNEQHI